MQHINLETFANGAFAEQVNRAMEEVAQNIQNPNTDAKKARKITITLTVKPNDQRDFSTVGIEAKTTLAPTLGVVTAMTIGKDIKTGEVQAVEIGNQIPGQMKFGDTEEVQEPASLKKVVDPSTGEVYEIPQEQMVQDNVIDLRNAREA